MAALTDEQVERAAEVMWRSLGGTGKWIGWAEWKDQCIYRKTVRAIAPYLQLPWDEPTSGEIEECAWGGLAFKEFIHSSIINFVRRRNAAFPPKPIDPRREMLVSVIRDSSSWSVSAEELADKIMAVLGETKVEGEFGFTGFKQPPVDQESPYLDSQLYPDTRKMPQPREPFKRNPADEVK